MNATVPPCAGRWELFDSTELVDHIEARALCQECPMRLACADRLRETRKIAYSRQYGPRGTWAGELVGPRPKVQRVIATEDSQWSDVDLRAAHTAYTHRGDRSAWARKGERVYNRKRKRKQAAEETAA